MCAASTGEKTVCDEEKSCLHLFLCTMEKKVVFLFFLFFMGPMIPVESTRLFLFVGIHGLRGGSDSEECVARALGKVS